MFFPVMQDFLNEKMADDSGLTAVHGFLNEKVNDFLKSSERDFLLKANQYYENDMDIDFMKQNARGLYSSKLKNGFIKKLVDQKVQYVFTKPFNICGAVRRQEELFNRVFNHSFLRTLKAIATEAIVKGVCYVQPVFHNEGIQFFVLPSEEVIPIWEDGNKTVLSSLVRVYDVMVLDDLGHEKKVRQVDYYTKQGIFYYIWSDGKVCEDLRRGSFSPYFYYRNEGVGIPSDKGFGFDRLPVVPFKYNDRGEPLLNAVKSLVDEYNLLSSVLCDLLSNSPNFVYVIRNYGGQDLTEFLRDLQTYRVIKVDDNGDVNKLSATVESDAVLSMLNQLRKSIYEFGRAIDTQGELFNNVSGIAMKLRYGDLDLDANGIDTEFQFSLSKLCYFVAKYFTLLGEADYSGHDVSFIFNRDMLVFESDVISDCKNSVGVLSLETILRNHPYVSDVSAEMDRIKVERGVKGSE